MCQHLQSPYPGLMLMMLREGASGSENTDGQKGQLDTVQVVRLSVPQLPPYAMNISL